MKRHRRGSWYAVVFSVMLCCIFITGQANAHESCERDTIASLLDQGDVQDKSTQSIEDISKSKKRHEQLKALFLASIISSGISIVNAQEAQGQDRDTADIMNIVNVDQVDALQRTYDEIHVNIYNGDGKQWQEACSEHGGIKGDRYKDVGAFVVEDANRYVMYFKDSTAFYLDFAHELVHALEPDFDEILGHLRMLDGMMDKLPKQDSKKLKKTFNDLLLFIDGNVPMEYLGPSWNDRGEVLPIAREFYAYYYQFLSLGLLNNTLTEYQKSFLGEFAEDFIEKMHAFHQELKQHETLFEFLMSYYHEKGLLTDLRITFYSDGTYDAIDDASYIPSDTASAQVSHEVIPLQSA